MLVKVVGPCASGKSTLVTGLRELGYDAQPAAQDHSFVPDMWRRLDPPDTLIYLDVSVDVARQRGRIGIGWDQAYLDEENHRLRHARANCDLYVHTDALTEQEVLSTVHAFLQSLPRSCNKPLRT